MDYDNGRFRNLVQKLPRYLNREEQKRARVQQYFVEVWHPKRTNVLALVSISISKFKYEKKQSNDIHIASKTASIIGKSMILSGSFLCPPFAIAGLLTSFFADGLSLAVSAGDAEITDQLLKKINKALREDGENTKHLQSLISDFKMALSDLNNFIDDFYKATRQCTWDSVGLEYKLFLNEVHMIEQLDPIGLAAFLTACFKLVGRSVSSSIRSLVTSLPLFRKYNPATLDSLGCTLRILTVDAFSAGSILSSIKNVGMAGAKMGKFVTGLNVFFIGKDIADIKELSDENEAVNFTTDTAIRLEEIEKHLTSEKNLLLDGLAKLN